MLHRRGITLTTVLAVLLAAGCTSQDDPEPPPIVSSPSETAPEPSPTPSPTPTPTQAPVVAPEPPAELERTDEVGAAAAAEYFLELYGYVMQTGDAATWNSMTWESCRFCSETSQLAAAINSSDETFTGGEIVVASTFVHPYDELVGGYAVDLTFSQTESQHRSPDGETIAEGEPDDGTLGVDVMRLDDGWVVLAVTAQDA